MFDYDFTDLETETHDKHVKKNEMIREILDFKGVAWKDEEMEL